MASRDSSIRGMPRASLERATKVTDELDGSAHAANNASANDHLTLSTVTRPRLLALALAVALALPRLLLSFGRGCRCSRRRPERDDRRRNQRPEQLRPDRLLQHVHEQQQRRDDEHTDPELCVL